VYHREHIVVAVSAIPTSRLLPREPALGEDIQRAALLLLAGVQLGLAVFMAAAPHAFYSAVGPFGVQNAHYIRDVATFYAALGFGLAYAVGHRSWRVPMLAVTTIQYGLHSVNHLLDIGRAHPAWTGYLDFASLAATTLLLGWLLLLACRAAAAANSPRSQGDPS